MKYIDNLIAWGDQLFRRDSIESNNEATQLYVLAAQILGNRPRSILAHDGKKLLTVRKLKVKTFNDIKGNLDKLSNIFRTSTSRATRWPMTLPNKRRRHTKHELGKTDTSFINFGYWDSLKKGLLADERLHYDLKHMEVAYMEQNKRGIIGTYFILTR